METYTTTLFLAGERDGDTLDLYFFYSLGKNIKKNCKVLSGEGIIGWVFREQKSVLATYFDKRDATTLKFYEKDEDIKSLIAIPLPEKYGVLCIDSKKSYVFTEEKEKILKQMAHVLVAIMKAEKEISEKVVLEHILSLSMNTNELIVNTTNKNDFVRKFLNLLIEMVQLEIAIVIIEEDVIYCAYNVNEKKYFEEFPYDYLDKYGLAGLVIKNKKELFLEKINKNDKSFILYKNEPFGKFTNFLGFPTRCIDSKNIATLAFVKKINEKWLVKEKKYISYIGNLFFQEYINKK
ncbi:MAG: GAF domain-containing protein [Deltaproteobacteria bacterium]|nr:GAF domain-containing protein [Deltaproteobacteria bacterium]